MTDYPSSFLDVGASAHISPQGPGSQVVDVLRNMGVSLSTGRAYAALVVYYVPVMVSVPKTIYGAAWNNGSTVSGNLDAGLYDSEGNRLANIGSTAMSGASVIQAVSFGSPVSIAPGLYYTAFVVDNATATFNRGTSTTIQQMRAVGVQTQTLGALPLPSSWTPTTPTALLPGVMIATQATF